MDFITVIPSGTKLKISTSQKAETQKVNGGVVQAYESKVFESQNITRV
jgi:hypothetical protein